LIAVPSVNPAFLPAGHPFAGEAAVGELVAGWGRKAGLEVELQEALPGRLNVLLHYRPSGAIQRRILMAPHLDTVGSLDGSDEVFQPRVDHARIWGRGACDTKGSVAAMLAALLHTTEHVQRPRSTAITFAGLVDEENCQLGSRALVDAGFKANLGIVGEPTQLAVVTAHKGDVWARLTVRGKAAHGAHPERGQNAIRTMARAVELLEGPYAKSIRRRAHPLLGHPTINVGVIRGGSQPNIVPDRCSIEVDRRTLPGETAPGVKREIVAFLRRHGVRATLDDVKGVPEPALETDPEAGSVKDFMRAVGRTKTLGVHYFCDAAIIAMGGTPCVVFGPGNIAQAHTAREWISLASLEGGTAMLTRFLQTLP
jgi:acetylornithine deacetylase/succinyl-diaminopimelate desuccinylase-like protein